MQVISAEIFNQKIAPGNSHIYKIYQDKVLIQGPVFSLDQKKLAFQYCQAYLKKNPDSLCLLVQEKYYFQSWKEDSSIQDNIDSDQKAISKNTYLISQENNIISVKTSKKQSINTEIVLEFINLCQQSLSQAIGPIGVVICKKISSQNPDLSCRKFIEILAQKIPDSQQSIEFKKELLQFTKENIGLDVLLQEMSEQLQYGNLEVDIINTIDLYKISTMMRAPGGITIKNRRYNLKIYPRCFIGREVVDWMIKNINLSTEQSVRLGQRLIDEKIIYHVTNQVNFANKHLLYRFYEDKIK